MTDAAQLEAVSARVANSSRQSFRATPATVAVEWPGVEEAAQTFLSATWPANALGALDSLYPVLQAVLTYRAGDWFEAHVDRCEQNGQEGVLIVDLGLREGECDADAEPPAYAADRPELFVVGGGSSAVVANWSASGPGAWIAMPMRVLHGVYRQPSRRTVAVYTLLNKLVTGNGPMWRLPSCSACRDESCFVHECPPGVECVYT